MALTSMSDILADAKRGGYSVCYCESWDLPSLQAVVEAAEICQVPTIIGFNGAFLMHEGRARSEVLSYYAGLGLAAAESSNLPMALLLNETDSLEQIERGIDVGFNAVMVENANCDYVEYLELVKKVTCLAHARNVSVEAQVGHLPDGCGNQEGHGEITDADQAKEFAEATGIDALGISIGNVHVQLEGKSTVDMDALRRIQSVVEIPMVVHGGTGFPADRAQDVIRLGVAKFNFGTNLKQVYLSALKEKLKGYCESMNPHPVIGMGGDQDVMTAARDAVRSKAVEIIRNYSHVCQPAKILAKPVD